MPFTSTNDVNILQAADSAFVGAGLGVDKYIVTPVSFGASKSITISDAGANTLQFIGGLTIVSSLVVSDTLKLTLSNGCTLTVLGASLFSFEIGGNPLSGTPGVLQNFSTFVTSTLLTTVPAAGAPPVAGQPGVEITDGGVPPVTVFTLTSDSPSITEGDSGSKVLTFSLNLDRAPTSAVVVNYQSLTSGTASAGDDFVPVANTVTFAAGQTVATVAITVNGDTVFEPNETIDVRFSGTSLAGSVTATGTITNNDIDTANQAQIFTLTTGADTIPGLIGSNGTSSTTGNDTISAIIENSGTNGASNTSTLNSGDTLNVGSGADVLNVRVISLTGAAAVTPVLTSVETVSVSNSDGSGNNAAINLASATGTTTVQFKDNAVASNTTFLNAASTAAISLDNADSSVGQNVNLGVATGRTGSADAFAISIANGTGSSELAAGFNLVKPDGTDDTSFEAANITVAGASSFVLVGTAGAALTSINLSGTSTGVTSGYGLTLFQMSRFDNLGTVNASGLTDGGINIDARGSSATGFAFTGSNSNDRVVLTSTTLNTAGALAGGGGTKDTLATTSFNVTASVVNSATGFEVLESVNSESSLVANSFTKINEFLFSGGSSNSNRLNITGVESNDRFVFASDQGDNSDEPIRFTGANVGTTVLFELRASPEANGEVTIIANDGGQDDVSVIGFQGNVSAVTIDSTGQNAIANLIESIDNNRDNYWAINNENGLSNFTITGSQALTIGAKEGVDLSSSSKTAGFHNSANVNASAFTSFLRIAGSNSDDVITGGSGMDIIYGLGGADTLTGNGGDDHFRMTGNSGADVIKDFVVGTDKIGINNVDFGNTTATSAGTTLAAADYVSNRTGITSIGASDNNKVIELQATFSTSQIQSDVGAAVQAYVIVFNSTTGKGELWFDNNWGDDGGRSLVVTFDNVVSLTGVTSFSNLDFVEFIA